MSELKATSSGEIRARKALLGYWWYEQSEAVKELYEKNKELRRQKYKRCLAMAERWLFAFYVTNKCNDKFYLRSLKYRELAEQFKEKK